MRPVLYLERRRLLVRRPTDEYGCPEQTVTDNGSRYCTFRGGDIYNHVFGCHLIDHSIRHIRSRVSHLQMKGKVERFFREGDQCLWRKKSCSDDISLMFVKWSWSASTSMNYRRVPSFTILSKRLIDLRREKGLHRNQLQPFSRPISN